MKLLITGFEPFDKELINPSWEAVNSLNDNIDNIIINKLQLPTVFKKSYIKLFEHIEKIKPDIVICVGQAGGRYDISIERVAINIDDARIEDNEGYKPIDEKIFEDGENAYFSSLPIKAIVQELKKFNIPASVSNTAGTYVCNHIMYALLYYINKPNTPYMDKNTIIKALEICIKTSFSFDNDIKISAGKEF